MKPLIKRFVQSHKTTLVLVWTLFGGLALDTAQTWIVKGRVNWVDVKLAAASILFAYLRSPRDAQKVTTIATPATTITEKVESA